MEETLMERLRRMADRVISERPSDRVLNFTLDGEEYWIKRKLGNGRNQLVKYSVEKEFYYEIARMTIAGRNNPDLVPEIEVLTPDYMVTKDGGPTVKNWLDSDKSEAEKELILEEAGAALAALHKNGIVHGRPALRDITWNDGVIHFLDWENRMYSQDPATQKALDFILLLQGIYRENYPEARERADALERGLRQKRRRRNERGSAPFPDEAFHRRIPDTPARALQDEGHRIRQKNLRPSSDLTGLLLLPAGLAPYILKDRNR